MAEQMLAQPEAPEQDVARHMALRGLLLGPVLLAVCAGVWGLGGLWSSGYALGLALFNLLLAAWLITWSARIGPQVLLAGVLGGYFVRLGILTGAYFLVRGTGWFETVPFAVTLLATHILLLVWETRHVSLTLAHPGLKPQGARS